jgi:hypothetical protein
MAGHELNRTLAHSMCILVRPRRQPVSPLTCVLHLPCTPTGRDTAGAGQHRLVSQISTIAGLRTSGSRTE